MSQTLAEQIAATMGSISFWEKKLWFSYALVFSQDIFETFMPESGLKIETPKAASLKIAGAFLHTVKSRAVDQSTIQFWNFMAKGHST